MSPSIYGVPSLRRATDRSSRARGYARTVPGAARGVCCYGESATDLSLREPREDSARACDAAARIAHVDDLRKLRNALTSPPCARPLSTRARASVRRRGRHPAEELRGRLVPLREHPV